MNIDNTPHLTRLKQALAATQNDLQTIALRRVEASGIIAEVAAIDSDRRELKAQRDKMVDALSTAVSGPCCLETHSKNVRTIEALRGELAQANKDLREALDGLKRGAQEFARQGVQLVDARNEKANAEADREERVMKADEMCRMLEHHARDSQKAREKAEAERAAATDRAENAEAQVRDRERLAQDIAKQRDEFVERAVYAEKQALLLRERAEKAEAERDEVGVQMVAARENERAARALLDLAHARIAAAQRSLSVPTA